MKKQNQPSMNRWIWIGLGSIFLLFIVVQIASLTFDKNKFQLGEKIGIITLNGPIFSSEKIVENLDKFGERNDIKAIVLRIDSPYSW